MPAAAPYRVCFICSGNICRSPTAEVVLRQLLEQAGLGERVVVDSGGTGSWNVGEPLHGPALRELRRHGYDGTAHRARQLEAGWLAERDLVLAADNGHARALRRAARNDEERARVRMIREFDPEAVAAGTLEVDDPYHGRTADFERAFTEVERACRGLVEQLRQRLDGTGPQR